jgi:hypothetical protein
MLESENADVAVVHMMLCATVIVPMWVCTVQCSVLEYGTGHVLMLYEAAL